MTLNEVGTQTRISVSTTTTTDCLPSSALFLLSPAEIAELSCGSSLERGHMWTGEEMTAAVCADHGYTNESDQVLWLVDVVSNQFAPKEQSKFLEFCTGCPRLPVGGSGQDWKDHSRQEGCGGQWQQRW